jgi:preprotein translocase subunit SecD
LSGLLLCGVLAWPGAASGEPLTIEIVSAELAFDQRTGMPVITFRMNEASKQLFAELTAKNIGKKMDVRVEGQTIMSPYIREPILGGSGQITERAWTVEQAKEMAERISAGRAKVEFEIVND